MREYVWLECTACGSRNYRTQKETRVFCLDADSGRVVWQHPAVKRANGQVREDLAAVAPESGVPPDFEAQPSALVDHPKKRNARVNVMRARAGDLAWERESGRYLDLVERLARDR